MNILVVDDNAMNRKLLRVTLEAEGYAICEAADGVEALAVLERETVDAVISDILMPNMDGYRFCYEVRHNERFRHLPFILYTATYTSPSDEKLSVELGVDRFLRKPVATATLITVLHEVMNAARRSEPRPASPPADLNFMKEYSEQLVKKLEEKNHELAERAEQLHTAHEELRRLNAELEDRVRRRTTELTGANQELDGFAYAVTHNLRAPLRALNGFSQALQEDYGERLDGEARIYLDQIILASRQINELIDGLLVLSRSTRGGLRRDPVDLAALAERVLAELAAAEPERQVTWEVEPALCVWGNPIMLGVLMRNLIENAWKYTAKTSNAAIRVYTDHQDGERCFCVADNGAGFDMSHASRLFQAFQRLHRQDEFPGIGIGLATVQRIIQRHGGDIRAKAAPGCGATFCFTLPYP